MNHESLVASLLEKIIKKNIDQAEVYLSSTKTLKIDVHEQKVESIDEIRDQGLGIRVIRDKKLGFAYTSDFDDYVLAETISRAVENAKSSEADGSNLLPGSQANEPLRLFDPKINDTPIEQKIKLALSIEASAYKADQRIKKTDKVTYSDSESEISIANSHGLRGNYRTNSCGAFAEVIAVQNGEMESGMGMNYVKLFDNLKPEAIGQEAANRALELLNAGLVPTQKLPLVFEPFVASQILEVLATALSSDAVQKGKSLFADKMDKAVGSSLLNIIDNGRLPGGLESSPFDGEGVATQETKLIENGVVRNFLFNFYTANKGGSKSTGNAVRASFKSPPAVGPTNLYIATGSQEPGAIIKSLTKGLYITSLMGIHTANPISGDFSFGAAGLIIENGKKGYPVRGVTVAGNLIEMLKGLEAVGSDLRFIANIGSPTLLISGLTISGG
ncbi:MAG: TldD/PmbA family protein [Candidatus Margulisbacteria bacterium]|nr:TldD/PmbA family protein [Candidatus Margulisiibacteriota bacterium]